ncbi:hypothetical protein IQ279_16270 [Streptomyces verrucosisporus]|uniref:LAETG motif-containing sortase-dependent surface protein n=1 Tax=Streptomyces verrucosisporus TaxID=1695161 RepID=UPI0019D2DEFB|nr:LAETG motif-containing sortase-dependent surface protein [Streptomyces verrucosisporus]MBN3931167.1 hypothetical protein [Streptomyces verrucosisporus]
MKLRRALAAAAATAVIAPVALLAAPAAYADDHETTSVENTETPAPEKTDGGEADSPATGDEDGTGEDGTDAPATGGDETEENGTEPPATGDGDGRDEDSDTPDEGEETPSPSPSPSESGGRDEDEAGEDEPWSPYECEKIDLDENLSAVINGLPNRIVAGSGWHDFTFSVRNSSDRTLKNVYVDAFAEYSDEVEESLYVDLAQIQYKNPQNGKWTDSYQEYYEDEDGKFVFSGSFVGIIGQLDPKASVDMELRVRIDAAAPAGSSFAISNAVYAGEDRGDCRGNGDFYEFTVLKAGSDPGKVGDAAPNGKKPQGGGKPLGGGKALSGEKAGESRTLPVDGKLAETGSSSALPMFGLAGAAAVALGAGAMYVVRRRSGAGADTSAAA